MNVYRFNGSVWWLDKRPLLKRLRQWVLWLGGYERSDGTWDRSGGDPTPVSVLGHRATYYGWGFQVRTAYGWLVVVWRVNGKPWSGIERAYVSPCGTPQHATIWLVGTPPEIVKNVEQRARA